MPAAAPFPPAELVEANGVRLAVHRAGEGPAVLLLHGFPELAFSWRHQVPALVAAGFSVLAPDQRGYGASDRPADPSQYGLRTLVADAVGVLDAFGIERAVVVGHDFGGMPAWWSGVYAPERVAGIVGVCTPFAPRLAVDLVEAYRRGRGESTYIVGFQRPGVAEALLERDVEATFRAWLRGVGVSQEAFAQQPAAVRALPMDLCFAHPELLGDPVVDEEELAVYVETYRRTCFTGGLNWYRALGLWHAESAGVDARVDVPSLMISAADDLYLPPAVTAGMGERVADLSRTLIPDAGHWVTQERPDAFNAALLDWLAPRFGR